MDEVRFRLANRSMEITVTGKKVWLITDAGRGMGSISRGLRWRRAIAVVATGRNPDAVTKALDLLAARLDITNPADADAAVASRGIPRGAGSGPKCRRLPCGPVGLGQFRS